MSKSNVLLKALAKGAKIASIYVYNHDGYQVEPHVVKILNALRAGCSAVQIVTYRNNKQSIDYIRRTLETLSLPNEEIHFENNETYLLVTIKFK